MPKVVDVAQRRAVIAEACWRVIVRDGIAGVTTRKVAAEAEVGTSLLFHYFSSKDEIIHASFELLQDRLRARLYPAMQRASDPLERLRVMARSNLPLQESQHIEFGVWLSLWAHSYSSDPLRDEQRVLYQRWRDLLEGVVREAIKAGLVRDDVDPRVAAAQIAALTDGLIVQLTLESHRPEIADLAVEAVDELIDGWRATTAGRDSRSSQPARAVAT